jgi:hypothetical protein
MEKDDALDEATKLWLRERIAALRDLDAMDEKAQRRAWQEIRTTRNRSGEIRRPKSSYRAS